MSTKFVYTLPDDPPLENHASCIAGFLHIFDQQPNILNRKHHFHHHHHHHHHHHFGHSATPKSSEHVFDSKDEDSGFSLPEDNDDQVLNVAGRLSLDHLIKASGKPKHPFRPSSLNDNCWSADYCSYADFDTENAIRATLMKQQDQSRNWQDERDKYRNSNRIKHNLNLGEDILRESMQHSLNRLTESSLHLRDHFGYPLTSFDTPRASVDGLEKSCNFMGLNYKDVLPRHSLDARENGATTLEELRESIRRLAKTQEDGYEAPMPSPVLRMDACMSPFSDNSLEFCKEVKEPPRSTSFDYKEAMRFRQKLIKEEPRLSLDSRTIPKCVIEIRQALQAHLDDLEIPTSFSTPDVKLASRSTKLDGSVAGVMTNKEAAPKASRRRLPSVIARLMGLEHLPDVSPIGKPKSVQKKPSKEAKLVQELLHCKPPGKPVQLQKPVRKGHGRSNQEQAPEKHMLSSLVSRLRESWQVDAKEQIENVEPLEVHCKQMQEPASVIKLQQKVIVPVSASIFTKEEKESPRNQDQMRERVESDIKNDHFQNEIEERLRQLGLQSSEHERKTLKQILEAMHLKGLFQVSPMKQPRDLKVESEIWLKPSSNEKVNLDISSQTTKIQESSKFDDSSERSHRSNTLMEKTQTNRLAEAKTEASIVIIKPLSKSLTATVDPLSTTNNDTGKSMRARKNPSTKPEIICTKERSCSTQRLKRSESNRLASPRQEQYTDKPSKEPLLALKPRRESPVNEIVVKDRTNQAIMNKKHLETSKKPTKSDSRLHSASLQERKTVSSRKQSVREENVILAPSNQNSVVSPISQERKIAGSQKQSIREENAVSSPSNRNSVIPPVRKDSDRAGKIGYRSSKLTDKKLVKPSQCRESGEQAANKSARLTTTSLSHSAKGAKTAFHNLLDEPQECKTPIKVRVYGNIDSHEDVQSSPISVLDSTHSDTSEHSPDSRGDLGSAKNSLHQLSDECLTRVSLLQQCSSFSMHAPLAEFNADFEYVQEIMLSTSIDTMARRWFLHGSPIDVNALYLTLEAQREGEDVKLAMVDRDCGGELYMKNRQEAMRRKLLLDCVNEILSRKVWRNVFQQGRRKGQGGMLKEIWEDVERLVMIAGPVAGQDDIYGILEKDLEVKEGHYGHDGQVINIVDEVSEIMLLDLVGELVSELP